MQPGHPEPPLTCTKPQSGWSAQCSSREGQQQPRRSTRSRSSISTRGTRSRGELSGEQSWGQRAPRARATSRSRTRTRSGPGWARTPRSLGSPGKPRLPFRCSLHIRRPFAHTHSSRHPRTHSPSWRTCPEPCVHTSALCTPQPCAHLHPVHTSTRSQAHGPAPRHHPRNSQLQLTPTVETFQTGRAPLTRGAHPQTQPCTPAGRCLHTRCPCAHPTRKSPAARTLRAPPALTAHTATRALPCAPPAPGRALPSPASRLRARAPPRAPSSAPSLQGLTPPGLGAAPAEPARRREVALPPRQTVPEPPDGPHLKPAASPVPRPLGGASVLTLATARAPGGFACRGKSVGSRSKSLRTAGASGAPELGSRARRTRTRWLPAAPGSAQGGRGGPRRPGPGGLPRRRRGRGKSPPGPPGPGAPFPGPRPPVAPRGCPGRGGAELSSSVSPARERKQREPLAGSARSGSRAAGGGEINNARKRKTDVSSPASRPGCAPARAPRRRRRRRRCSDSSSPSSEAIVYWALRP